MFKKAILAVGAVALLFGAGTALASAHQNVDQKITICHGTNSVTNAYVSESVDVNGLNGHGNHTGPLATSQTVAQQLKDNKTQWGDIIPPTDTYAGLNWTSQGQAIYNNGCNYVTSVKGDGDCTGHETVGRCADKCPNQSDTLLGFNPTTGAAVCKAACSDPGYFVRGFDKETGAPVCGHVTGCPYGDSVPLGPECDKLAPQQPTNQVVQTPDGPFTGK